MFCSMHFLFLEDGNVTETIKYLSLLRISFSVSCAFFILDNFIGEIQYHLVNFFNGAMSLKAINQH